MSEAQPALLEVDELRVHYGRGTRRSPTFEAVAGVSFGVSAGESVGLVGESGCGKSSTARAVVGLVRPASGRVVFAGHDIADHSREREREFRRSVQIVFQDSHSALHPRMTAADLITEPWRVNPGIVERSEWRAECRRLLELVGLRSEHGERYPRQMSGGQRQRVGIARALAMRPRLIVCDEPVSSLDVSVQAQILTLLEDLQQQLSLAYLFISHDLGVVRQTCDRVLVMHAGQIVEAGTAEAICTRPEHIYTQALLAAAAATDIGAWADAHEQGSR